MKKLFLVLLKIIGFFIGFLLLLFVIFYFSTSGNYQVAKTVAQDPSIPHITLDGTTFHAETFGNDSNEVVIIIHGGPGNDYKYLLSLKDLADDYFVVFYDQRGTGLSPRVPKEELTLESSISDLNNIIQHYAPHRKVHLIGHSWGGMLASAYLGRYPDKVDKAVLAEPGILTTEKGLEFMEKTKPDISFKFLKHLGHSWFKSLHVENIDEEAQSDYFFMSFALDVDSGLLKQHPLKGYYCNEDVRTGSMDYWRYSFAANTAIFQSGYDENDELNINLVKGVEKFENKVLFLSGECNTLIGQEFQKDHMVYFNKVELVVIPNSGHTMFGEKPQESIAAVRSYFNE